MDKKNPIQLALKSMRLNYLIPILRLCLLGLLAYWALRCAPEPANACEVAMWDCEAEYMSTRPFSAYTLFRHCSNDYGTCVGEAGLVCEEACASAHDPRRFCEPSCYIAGGRHAE